MVWQFEHETATYARVFLPSVTDEEDLRRIRDGYPWGETDRDRTSMDRWARWWWAAVASCLVALVLVVVAVVSWQIDATIPQAPAGPSFGELRDAATAKVDRRSPIERGVDRVEGRGGDR